MGLPAIRWIPFATEAGYQSAPAWSPDGKQIAYEAEVDGVVQVFTRQVGSAGRTQVTHSTFDCHVSAWSARGCRPQRPRAESRRDVGRELELQEQGEGNGVGSRCRRDRL
jgi:hypothetical protein